MDSICHLMCSNKFKFTTLSVPSPFVQNQIIDLHVQSNEITTTQVSIINGSPYISVDINLKATVESSEFGLDLSNSKNLQLISDSASSFIKNNILDYLYKTSKDFHSDICRIW